MVGPIVSLIYKERLMISLVKLNCDYENEGLKRVTKVIILFFLFAEILNNSYLQLFKEKETIDLRGRESGIIGKRIRGGEHRRGSFSSVWTLRIEERSSKTQNGVVDLRLL